MAAIKGNFKERNRKSCQTDALGTAADTVCTEDNIYIPFLSKIRIRTLQEQPEPTVEILLVQIIESAVSFCHSRLLVNVVAYVFGQNLNSGQSFSNA